jgi:hypothetical protein
MATIRGAYAPIDVNLKEPPPMWPATIPALTFPEAVRATRRLWRFGMGTTTQRKFQHSTGDSRAANPYRKAGTFHLNPDRGWQELVHDLSHIMVQACNPGERPHSKFHARFEAKLVREVLKRGWLDGSLRDKPKAAIAPHDALHAKRMDKLARIDAAVERWERKHARAERAMAKLAKQRRYFAKAVEAGPQERPAKPASGPAKPRTPRAPKEGTMAWAKATAAAHGIELDPDRDGVWVSHPDFDDGDSDPLHGSHFCVGPAEVCEGVEAYVSALTKAKA